MPVNPNVLGSWNRLENRLAIWKMLEARSKRIGELESKPKEE